MDSDATQLRSTRNVELYSNSFCCQDPSTCELRTLCNRGLSPFSRKFDSRSLARLRRDGVKIQSCSAIFWMLLQYPNINTTETAECVALCLRLRCLLGDVLGVLRENVFPVFLANQCHFRHEILTMLGEFYYGMASPQPSDCALCESPILSLASKPDNIGNGAVLVFGQYMTYRQISRTLALIKFLIDLKKAQLLSNYSAMSQIYCCVNHMWWPYHFNLYSIGYFYDLQEKMQRLLCVPTLQKSCVLAILKALKGNSGLVWDLDLTWPVKRLFSLNLHRLASSACDPVLLCKILKTMEWGNLIKQKKKKRCNR